VAIAISGSGTSPNVLNRVEAAGGNMQQIEDLHMVLAHVVYADMWEELTLRSRAPEPGRVESRAALARPRDMAEG